MSNDNNALLCPQINQSAEHIYELNKAKGFWDNERNVGEMLMLIVSELGEAMEAHRKHQFSDWEGYHNEEGQNGASEAFKANIKDTFEDEIADVAIRLLDLTGGLGIDLEKHLNHKVAYNKTRARLHGKKY